MDVDAFPLHDTAAVKSGLIHLDSSAKPFRLAVTAPHFDAVLG